MVCNCAEWKNNPHFVISRRQWILLAPELYTTSEWLSFNSWLSFVKWGHIGFDSQSGQGLTKLDACFILCHKCMSPHLHGLIWPSLVRNTGYKTLPSIHPFKWSHEISNIVQYVGVHNGVKAYLLVSVWYLLVQKWQLLCCYLLVVRQ